MARTLDLAALRSFLAIVEHGGVTRAAKRLNLTQSAVSMQLKRLEDGLGHILLERARKGMTPTAAGEQLASYARRMLELNDEALARLTEPSYQGDLILGAPHDVVYPHVPEVLRLFARAYPRVRIALHSSYTQQLKEQLKRGEIDVILTTETHPDAGAEVLEDCSSAEPVELARCAGYIMAVADMLGGASARIDGLEACLLGTEPLAELIGAVRRHLEANPARASMKGDGAVAYALSVYRPCAESDATFEERLLNR